MRRLLDGRFHLPPAWAAFYLASFWIVTSALAYRYWIHGADHRDFYARWTGARILLFEGRDLYRGDHPPDQLAIYGELLTPDQDQWGCLPGLDRRPPAPLLADR
jgi:hypothetical protein